MKSTAYRPQPPVPSLYLDYQSSTPLDPQAYSAMEPWLLRECGNPHAEHVRGRRALEAIEFARAQVSALIGCDPAEIFFTSGATEANNLALLGVGGVGPQSSRDTIVVSSIEHASVLEPAAELRRRGYRVIKLPVDAQGLVPPRSLSAVLDERVLLVSVCAVNNEIGTVQSLEALGTCCREVGALFHTDAAQSLVGADPSIAQAPIDFASFSSHKAYGPVGIGALYVAPEARLSIRPIMFGGNQQAGLRPGTLPTPLCVGFGAACQQLHLGGSEERKHVQSLRDELLRQLRFRLPALLVNGTMDQRHPGNLNIRLHGADARDAVQRMQPSIACSTGSACHSGSEEPSHVLRALGLSDTDAFSSIRVSLGRFTTALQVTTAAEGIARALAESCDSSIPVGLPGPAESAQLEAR